MLNIQYISFFKILIILHFEILFSTLLRDSR
nr:MAG TPA: hypothetical protein [Crassvirales sp.]